MYHMRNTPPRNYKNKLYYQIYSLVLAQFLAFLKTFNLNFAMLVLQRHCYSKIEMLMSQ